MQKIFISTFLCTFLTIEALACVGGKGYLPKNDFYIAANQKNLSGIGQVDFNDVLDKVSDIYSPIISRQGGNLDIHRLWDDGTVNAQAMRVGRDYIIKMFGGLARHADMTKDGFALVACHEIGHHIGGTPFYTTQGTPNWASTEGQSDYFAVTKCLRKLMATDDNENIVRSMSIDPVVEKKCDEQFTVSNDQAICKRIAMAGYATSSMFASMRNESPPRFDRPDSNVVTRTFESHPAYQCRLDTYFQGGACTVEETIDVSQTNPNVGTCNRKDGFKEGLRPLCWFKPSGVTNPNPNPGPGGDIARTPTVSGQTSVTVRNPNTTIPIQLDLRGHQNVYGFLVEMSKPNKRFSNPNGTSTDRVNSLGHELYRGTHGVYRLTPIRQLPGYGTYQFRVMALDQNKRPVSKSSNVLTINVSR